MRLAKNVYFSIALIVCFLIILKSIDYLNPDFSEGFLIGKGVIFTFYKVFLFMHMAGAPIALLAGLFQFTFTNSKIHRAIGILYLGGVLLLAAPSGFIMAFFAIGGFWSVLNFLILSLLWFYFSLKAYQLIRKGIIDEHRKFMTRSFILTNSAIGIRVLSYLNNQFQLIDGELGYVLISWISWVPALLVFELLNRQTSNT